MGKNRGGFNNPGNAIKAKAKAKDSKYWAIHGGVANQQHDELAELEAYRIKCAVRKKQKA